MRILITGGAGLVGSECCIYFAREGHEVISVDNYMRGKIFGKAAETKATIEKVLKEFPSIQHIEADIRNVEKMEPLIAEADIIIHTASQPSHPRSIEIPIEDFSINAQGTLYLLELARQNNPDLIFIFCSTNKVYGDNPNRLPFIEQETRFDFRDIDGIDETLPIDSCMHTPFGVSKVAADLYTQEYARLYGMKTGVFRMGCITGGAARAIQMHNWEPFFVRKNLIGETLSIYGFKGKQVRDVIHAKDLVALFGKFIEKPRPGEVYNVGGGRKNSVSLLEAIKRIESITGRITKCKFESQRQGDHRVYITDMSKVKKHYDWDITIGVTEIFKELCETIADELNLAM